MTQHLGHPPGGRAQGPNVRNGANAKTVQTDLGPVDVKTPRDRQGSFAPLILPKRQTRLAGLDEKVLGLYAGGMTVRDISSHLSERHEGLTCAASTRRGHPHGEPRCACSAGARRTPRPRGRP